MKNGPFERPLFVYMRCDFVILSFDLFSHLNVLEKSSHDLLINVLWFLLDGNRFVSIKIGIAFHSRFEWMDLLRFQFALPAPNECDYIVRVHIGYFIFFCSSKILYMPIHTWNWSHLVRAEPNKTTRHEFFCNYRIWAYFNSPLHKTGRTNIKSEWKPKKRASYYACVKRRKKPFASFSVLCLQTKCTFFVLQLLDIVSVLGVNVWVYALVRFWFGYMRSVVWRHYICRSWEK